MRKVRIEIRKTVEGLFWGIVLDIAKDNNSRYITQDYTQYSDVIREGKMRAAQIGWDCIEVKDCADTDPYDRTDMLKG